MRSLISTLSPAVLMLSLPLGRAAPAQYPALDRRHHEPLPNPWLSVPMPTARNHAHEQPTPQSTSPPPTTTDSVEHSEGPRAAQTDERVRAERDAPVTRALRSCTRRPHTCTCDALDCLTRSGT